MSLPPLMPFSILMKKILMSLPATPTVRHPPLWSTSLRLTFSGNPAFSSAMRLQVLDDFHQNIDTPTHPHQWQRAGAS